MEPVADDTVEDESDIDFQKSGNNRSSEGDYFVEKSYSLRGDGGKGLFWCYI